MSVSQCRSLQGWDGGMERAEEEEEEEAAAVAVATMVVSLLPGEPICREERRDKRGEGEGSNKRPPNQISWDIITGEAREAGSVEGHSQPWPHIFSSSRNCVSLA